jgi:DUF438 domain-containing protein
MKTLVRQLHEGGSEDRIRKQLETILDQADYADVFQMEIQLIQEGIPQESIQQLCDSHTKVLKKHLDHQEAPETVPGHPVHTFIEENKALADTIKKIRNLFAQIDDSPAGAPAISTIRDIQSQLNLLMDVDKHYRRKENLLFPFFEKNDFPGPPAVMWGKHDETRELLRTTLEGLQQIESIDSQEATAFIELAIAPALEAVEEMIYKEEKIMLPMAMDLLTEQDWYEIYIQSDQIGFCIYVPEQVWQPTGGKHQEILQIAAESNRINMPTGSFELDELIAAFTAMPFDVTFVDKDDTVRYFSPGTERIFDRTRAILGRKVQYCHPPKSVHTVNQILADFKAGTQDRARFWINLGPKLVYIVYYALRDQAGVYRGTLEVTQDVTEIKALDGERRLLHYDQ